MNIKWCFENGSFKKTELLIENIVNLNSVIEDARRNDESIYKNDSIYCVEFCNNVSLSDWLFSGGSNDRDYRNMLMKLIMKSKDIDDEEYENVLSNTAGNNFGLLNLNRNNNDIIRVCSKDDRIKLLRHYLEKVISIDDFVQGLNKCFPNLYFHKNIGNTLRTLSTNIEIYCEVIVYHLSCINDVFPICFEQEKSRGMRAVLELFKNKTSIDCSVECSRATTKERLSFIFDHNVTVVCEPHTKLHSAGQGDNVRRYDRIYFHQGDERIQQGKILVGHIGEHL